MCYLQVLFSLRMPSLQRSPKQLFVDVPLDCEESIWSVLGMSLSSAPCHSFANYKNIFQTPGISNNKQARSYISPNKYSDVLALGWSVMSWCGTNAFGLSSELGGHLSLLC